MKVHHAPQGSEEWQAIRLGRPTASQFHRIITAAKGELSKSWKGYAIELIAECFVTGEEWTGNSWTDRGTELEPEARAAFAAHTGYEVIETGFCTRDDGLVGCSPDGLIHDGGKPIAGLEMKCPAAKTHVHYVLHGELPDDYKQQVHGGMAVTGLNEWHFWSYYPGLKPLHVVVKRDDYTEKLTEAVNQFVMDYAALRQSVIPKIKLPKP